MVLRGERQQVTIPSGDNRLRALRATEALQHFEFYFNGASFSTRTTLLSLSL